MRYKVFGLILLLGWWGLCLTLAIGAGLKVGKVVMTTAGDFVVGGIVAWVACVALGVIAAVVGWAGSKAIWRLASNVYRPRPVLLDEFLNHPALVAFREAEAKRDRRRNRGRK